MTAEKTSHFVDKMWCRRRRPSFCSLFLLVTGALGVLLVTVYNGASDSDRHTRPNIENHNTKNLLNIQQKVLKEKEEVSQFDDDARQSPEDDSGPDRHSDEKDDDSYSSSSNFSENEEEAQERPSDITGDNAREVRVSSSTNDDDSDNDHRNGAANNHHNGDGTNNNRPSVLGGEKNALDKMMGVIDGNDDAGLRTRVNDESVKEYHEQADKDEDGDEDDTGDGDGDDVRDDGGDAERMMNKKKRDYLHNWDEYDPKGWTNLPLFTSISDAEAQAGDAVIFNRVGKCGSRSVINVMRTLAVKNGFNFVSSLVYNKTRLSPPHERMIVSVLGRLERPYIFQRHLHFIDFRRYDVKQPQYINIIRDPLSRMVSQYYFKRFGDGKSDRGYSGNDKYQTFDECVLRGASECVGQRSFYIIPFFCGQELRCKEPTPWSLQEAIRNLNDHFVATGILEELEDTFMLFEKVLPDLFGGASAIYRKIVASESRMNVTFTKHKVKPSPKVTEIMRQHMKLEYLFYEYVKTKFQAQKRIFGIL